MAARCGQAVVPEVLHVGVHRQHLHQRLVERDGEGRGEADGVRGVEPLQPLPGDEHLPVPEDVLHGPGVGLLRRGQHAGRRVVRVNVRVVGGGWESPGGCVQGVQSHGALRTGEGGSFLSLNSPFCSQKKWCRLDKNSEKQCTHAPWRQ